MVSLTIFSIVMTTSIGSLLVIIDANGKAQALYSAMTNVSFAVDSLTRNIRMGYAYYCDGLGTVGDNPDMLPTGNKDCASGATGIAFTREKDNRRVGYRYNATDDSIEQKEGNGNWLRLTSNDVVIDRFELQTNNTNGVADNDVIQPQIRVIIEGRVNNGLDTDTPFSLQSHVTERTINY